MTYLRPGTGFTGLMITFRALGALELRRADGAELLSALAAPKRLALLTYLALARPGGFQRRDRLVALFWPDLDHRHARGALRQTLRLLRRSLGPAVLEARGAEEVGLASGQLWFDATAFEEAIAAGRLEEALALYRGDLLEDLFVTGASVELERWLEDERGRLKQLAAEGTAALASQAEATGDLGAAQRWARRAMELAPFDEAALRRLVAILDRAGDRAKALAAYHEFAGRLREELAAEPSPETEALVEEIRLGQGGPLTAGPVPDIGSTGAADAAVATPQTVGSDASSMRPHRASVRGFPVGPLKPRVSRGLVLLTLLALIVGAIAIAQRLSRPVTAARVSTNRIAVLPFTVRGSDEFGYLSEGMVELLSTKLDGAGPLRSVDPRALLSFVGRQGGDWTSPARALNVAERFDAGLFILGSVLEAGGRLELHAALYTADGVLRAEVSSGPSGETEVFGLVDELARKLIGGRYGRAAERLTRLAAMTTSSIPALKAYLGGERAFRAGRFDRAVEAFRAAVREDSGFALAYYRLNVAMEWAGEGLDARRRVAEEAMRRADDLSQHDRWLLQASVAWRRGAGAEAASLYRSIVERYPDDVDAWFQLGEVLFHYNPLLGRPLAEARVPFGRVLAFEPDNLGARLHLARLAAAERRLAELDTLANVELNGDPRALRVLLLRALAHGDTVEGARLLAELGEPDQYITPYVRNLGGAERVTRFAKLPHQPLWTRTHGHLDAAYLAIARGRWRAARQEFTAVESLDSAYALNHHALAAALPFLSVSGAELEALRDALSARRGVAWSADQHWRFMELSLYPHLRHYLLGLLAARLGELDAAATHVRAMEDPPSSAAFSPLLQDLARGLQATVAWREGHAEEALRILEGLNMELGYGGATSSPFFARTYERYLRAELLLALGRREESLRWYRSLAEFSNDGVMYLAPSHLRRAEIYEALGDRGRAMEHYARFVELWKDCDAELRPAVEAAQHRLAQLSRELTSE